MFSGISLPSCNYLTLFYCAIHRSEYFSPNGQTFNQIQTMNTIEPKTPTQIGLSITINSGPVGEVKDQDTDNPWPCIRYNVSLMRGDREIWRGEFRLGIGHVKPIPAPGMSFEHQNIVSHLKNHSRLNYKDTKTAQAVCFVAAMLAKHQRKAPSVEDVAHSLIMDGSAYFNAETFEDWADNYGYSSDSIKAEKLWRECIDTGMRLARGIPVNDLECLKEWASNY